MPDDNFSSRIHPPPPEPPWIIVSYYPGFAPDLTRWETRIGKDGYLFQTVHISRFSPSREEHTGYYDAQLTSEQIAEVQQLIAATDFDAPAAAARVMSVDDAPHFGMTVHESGRTVGFDGPLLQSPYAVPQFELSGAWNLWLALDALSPYGFHSDED